MRILFTIILFLSISAHAEDYTYKISPEKYFWLFSEDAKWVLNTVKIKSNSLPDVIKVENFDSKDLALAEIKKHSRAFQLISNKDVENIPQTMTEVQNRSVWEVKNQWSWEWEQKYAEWITQNSDLDFFEKLNIATDCADAVIAYRWIFARINFLPVAQNIGIGKGYITQDTMKKEWLSIPSDPDWKKDKRFFKALDYVQITTYTGTLLADSYPLDLTREAFIPGFHYLGNGHSMLSLGIIDNKSIQFNSSTVPREVRELILLDLFDEDHYTKDMTGLMRMKWPVKKNNSWSLTEKTLMPFYGLSQYSQDLLNNEYESTKFGIYLKLGLKFTSLDVYRTGMTSLLLQFLYRTMYVINGFNTCSQIDCSPGTQNYEDHSTFSRDKRMHKLATRIVQLKYENEDTDPEFLQLWEEFAPIKFSIKEEATEEEGGILYSDAVNIWLTQKYSSDPRDSINKRWGLE